VGECFFLVPAHPGCPGQSPERHKMVVIVVVDMCCVGTSLKGRSLFWAGPSPIFAEAKKITMVAIAHFALFFLISETCQWSSGKLLGCMLHILVFEGPSLIFTGGLQNF